MREMVENSLRWAIVALPQQRMRERREAEQNRSK